MVISIQELIILIIWNGLRYGLNIDLEKGIGGSRDFNEGLMGDFNPHFTTIKLNLETAYNFENGMLWNGKFGYQNSSSRAPSANFFILVDQIEVELIQLVLLQCLKVFIYPMC